MCYSMHYTCMKTRAYIYYVLVVTTPYTATHVLYISHDIVRVHIQGFILPPQVHMSRLNPDIMCTYPLWLCEYRVLFIDIMNWYWCRRKPLESDFPSRFQQVLYCLCCWRFQLQKFLKCFNILIILLNLMLTWWQHGNLLNHHRHWKERSYETRWQEFFVCCCGIAARADLWD